MCHDKDNIQHGRLTNALERLTKTSEGIITCGSHEVSMKGFALQPPKGVAVDTLIDDSNLIICYEYELIDDIVAALPREDLERDKREPTKSSEDVKILWLRM